MIRFHSLSRLFVLVSVLALSAPVQAALVPAATPLVHPTNGASSADVFYALFASNCGKPTLDPRRAPEIDRGEAPEGSGFELQVRVTYYVVAPDPDLVCAAVLLPDDLTPFTIGRLPEGRTEITQSQKIRDADSDTYTDLGGARSEIVTVGDTPNPAVSGAWYDSSASGMGLSLNLAPAADGGAPTAVVFLATLSPAGEPLWLAGAGTFVDATLRVPLTRTGGATGARTVTPAGTLTFEYLGCGEARLRIEGVDVQFPDDEALLQQLTETFGLPSCEPPTRRPGL